MTVLLTSAEKKLLRDAVELLERYGDSKSKAVGDTTGWTFYDYGSSAAGAVKVVLHEVESEEEKIMHQRKDGETNDTV